MNYTINVHDITKLNLLNVTKIRFFFEHHVDRNQIIFNLTKPFEYINTVFINLKPSTMTDLQLFTVSALVVYYCYRHPGSLQE